MHWADQLADQVIASGKHKPYWVDDMKTPSGRVHIGSVRAVVTHGLIHQALLNRKAKATFSYVLEDHDPMDGLPVYLDEKKFRGYMGMPLFKIPSPESGFKSFGDRWGQEYKDIFNALGVHPKVIWGSSLYLSGQMNEVIKVCLDKAQTIREIYWEVYGKQSKSKDWLPFTPVCEACGKLSTTVATDWDGKELSYVCKKDAVDWTEGCGHKGKRSPFSEKDDYAGKLPWKVEWACKWKVIGVTVEGAGKDHMTDGGSHDISRRICERVINYPTPFSFSHEFFLTGGRKMSSSKGIGSSAKEVAEIIPAYLIRFMIARVKYNRAINFNPLGDTIPDLFDNYDLAATAYWDKGNPILSRVFELSQLSGKPPKKMFLPRFRDMAQIMQDPKLNLIKEFTKVKGSALTKLEQEVLNERVKYVQIWLESYAPEEKKVGVVSNEVKVELTKVQKKYLKLISPLLEKSWKSPEDFQQALYDTAKENKLNPKEAFQSIYLSLTGKKFGPKAAWFLLDNLELAKKRFAEMIS
jgi:lysyl-tRNA synthetase class 1